MINTRQYLGQKQSLQQRLSPQQIQYIKLLQLPTLALEQRIKEEMEINPALEEANDESDADFEDQGELDTESLSEDDEVSAVDEHEEIDWEEILHNQESEGLDEQSVSYNNTDEDWRDLPKPSQDSLLEDLEQQVGLLDLSDREIIIADQILGSIDEDGYFRRDISSIVDGIAFNQAILVTEEEVEKVLQKIQTLDPPGIACRDLRECLLLQLRAYPKSTSGRELALLIIEKEWNAFERKHYDRLIKKFDIDKIKLTEAIDCIQTLDPKPGISNHLSDDRSEYIVPDFEVIFQPGEAAKQDEDEFIIHLNSRNTPSLKISPHFKQMWDSAKKAKKSPSANETQLFIKSKIESAKWFLESILQRRQTLMNVMQTIVALQSDFFKSGEGLKPMILKDVAERVKMDISTISRVVNGKYVQTQFGVFELKYFFNEGIITDSGEEVSNREVKNALLNIISGEDKKHPLSDLALVKKLKAKGYPIARRTVSKYREQLNVPVARLRKTII